jgi:hypothetical protein
MHLMRMGALCIVLLLSACETVRYEYKAPDTAEGRQCVVQCASVREACRSNENQRAQSEKRICEKRSETDYLVCMNKAKDNQEQQDKCKKERGQCYQSPDYQLCNDEYNQCFSNCGGVVTKIVEKY